MRSCRTSLVLALTWVWAGCAPAGPSALAVRLDDARNAYLRHEDAYAESLFRAALAEAPSTLSGRIRLALAATLLRQRRDEEAARELGEASRELAGVGAPDGPGDRDAAGDPGLVRMKATLALHARRLQQAERLFAALAAADPDDVQAQVGLACVQVARGDPRSAVAILDRAARLAPRRALVYYDRALAWDALGEAEPALRDARTAVGLDPAHVEARTNLATLLARAGRAAEAETELRAAVARFPTSATAHGNLGALLYVRGALPAAAAELEAAVTRAPAQPAFQFDLGLAYFALGDLGRARAAFERVLVLDPGNQGARRNLRFIDGKQRGLILGDDLPAGSLAAAAVGPARCDGCQTPTAARPPVFANLVADDDSRSRSCGGALAPRRDRRRGPPRAPHHRRRLRRRPPGGDAAEGADLRRGLGPVVKLLQAHAGGAS